MFVADWPLMFALGLFIAAVAISKGGARFWFSIGLLVSLVCIGVVVYIYSRAPDFVLIGLGLDPEHVTTSFLFVSYAWYVVSYAFGYTVGYYPLRGTLSNLVSKVRKKGPPRVV